MRAMRGTFKANGVLYCSRQSMSPSRAVVITKWRYYVYDANGSVPVFKVNRSP